jgi:Tol biopolymer transport system component
MTLASGTKLGTYEVTSHIGSGGMGEVYQARDTKLGRDVAIKVLPEQFAREPERLSRFQREAKLLAALNHPNIATIHGLEQSGDTHYLVMELVEGSTLAERIRGGAIPLDEALPIARQVADAVEYAHDKNVIHRDLKPANIKVKADGAVKVLDFGLAKAMSEDPSEGDMSNSPTLSMAATRQGVILGTAAYMSPEQARGKVVDRRTDVWAFGCVLYEMLTGKQAFHGEDVTDVLASVVKSDPAFNILPSITPPAIRNLLRRCLEKGLRRRLAHIGEARIIVEDALAGHADVPGDTAAASIPVQPFWKRALPWGLAAILAIVAGLSFWRPWSPPPSAPIVARFALALRPSEVLNWGNGGLAISPDGHYVAYASTLPGGTRQLFLRPMDGSEASPFPGTEDAGGLFFSPDSQWIAFTARGKLKKVPVAGGTPIVLCDRLSWNTGSWGPDGNIYYGDYGDTDNLTSKLMRVPAAGGTCEVVTTLEVKPGELGARWLEVLPGGETVLVVNQGTPGAFSDDAVILAQSLKTGEQKTLIQGGTSPHYLSTGHLIYAQSGRLLAVPFDPRRLAITGTAVPVFEDVAQGTGGYAAYALSAQGSLVYINGGQFGGRSRTTLNWVDRMGVARPLREEAHVFSRPNLSPDGRYLAIRNGDAGPGFDTWISDLIRGTLRRLTFAKSQSNEQVGTGVWTPDGRRVIYSLSGGSAAGGGGGSYKLMWRPADGTGTEEELLSGNEPMEPLGCSPDGQVVVFFRLRSGHRDLFTLSLIGEHKERPLIESSFNKFAAQISPNGRWIAYVSDESGRQEVFVQPFPDLNGKWQISAMGGTEPRWSRDGRQMFYRNGSKMMAVDIQTQAGFAAGIPRLLFDQPYATGNLYYYYDVAPDGQRFLMLKDIEEQTSQLELRMVLNWGEEVKRRVPAGTR